jgi:hypothetical protein
MNYLSQVYREQMDSLVQEVMMVKKEIVDIKEIQDQWVYLVQWDSEVIQELPVQWAKLAIL